MFVKEMCSLRGRLRDDLGGDEERSDGEEERGDGLFDREP